MDMGKLGLILALISIIISAGMAIYMFQLTGNIDERLAAIDERLAALEGATGIEENVFVLARYSGATTLDPCIEIDDISMHVTTNVYEPLFLMTMVGGKVTAFPHLVEEYEISTDLLNWTFKLIEGVKFHDGTEMTSEDVAFSMDRMLRMGKGFSYLWSGCMDVGDTIAIDRYSFSFILSEPLSQMEAYLTRFKVLNKDLIMDHIESGQYGEFGDYGVAWLNDGHDAGSGPYMIKEYDLLAGGTLVKFDDYRGGWKENQVTEIVCKVIPEHASQITALLSGEVDFIDYNIASTLQLEASQSSPHVITRADPMLAVTFITMNCKKPPLDDVHVRRALSYAFDYKAIYLSVDPGKPSAGPVPEIMKGYNDELEPYYLNLTKAQEELALSSYTTEELAGLEMEMLYLTGFQLHEVLALKLQEAAESLGLQVTLVGATWPEIAASGQSWETTKHFITFYQGAYYPSLDAFTYDMYCNETWGSFAQASFYSTPELNALYDQAHSSQTVDESLPFYKEAQRLILEAAPSLFVAQRTHYQSFRDSVVKWSYMGAPDSDWCAYGLLIVR